MLVSRVGGSGVDFTCSLDVNKRVLMVVAANKHVNERYSRRNGCYLDDDGLLSSLFLILTIHTEILGVYPQTLLLKSCFSSSFALVSHSSFIHPKRRSGGSFHDSDWLIINILACDWSTKCTSLKRLKLR